MKPEVEFSRSTFSSDTMKGTWIFFILFVLLLLTPAEFSDVVGHEPVQVTAGDDVILSCHLEPPYDVTDLTVEWELNGRTVHGYTDKKDNHDLQDKQFRGRTSLFHHELVKGNISLKLTNVTEDDSGLYICKVPRLQSQVNEGNVLLRVNPQKDPAGSGGDNETQDDKKPTRDQRGLIVSSVGLITVSAGTAFNYIKRRRREKNNQENYELGQQGNDEDAAV